MKKQHETRITVRFPTDLISELKKLALQHDRSLNSEIVQAVRLSIAQQKAEKQ
jgi:predicted transcriptional regulator